MVFAWAFKKAFAFFCELFCFLLVLHNFEFLCTYFVFKFFRLEVLPVLYFKLFSSLHLVVGTLGGLFIGWLGPWVVGPFSGLVLGWLVPWLFESLGGLVLVWLSPWVVGWFDVFFCVWLELAPT